MAVLRAEDGKRLYFVSCPECSASNPVNATVCWHCEHSLPDPGAPNPSFFPVLHDEVPGEAANDEPGWGASTSLMVAPDDHGTVVASDATRRAAWRGGFVGAGLIAAAAGLAFLLFGRADEKPAPLPRTMAPLEVGRALSATPPVTAVLPTPTPAPTPAPMPSPPRAAVIAPAVAEADAPAPPPVKGPCTPDIAALGLCSIDSR